MKIAAITSIATPYRDPYWHTLSQQKDVELTVYYCKKATKERPWKTTWPSCENSHYLPGIALLPPGNCVLNPSILSHLVKNSYDVILFSGYNHITILLALLYCIATNTPYYLMSEVFLAQPRLGINKILKYPLLKFISATASGGFPTGTLASEYLTHYGFKANQLCKLPNVPDIKSFQSFSQNFTTADINNFLMSENLPSKPTILFVGRLIPLKQVDTLILAFSKISDTIDCQMVIIGDGPELTRLKTLVESKDLTEKIIFKGFVEPEKVKYWYASSNLFVLPSSDETWGAVVIEALASGLAIILSDMVGSHRDAISSDEVGTVVKSESVDELATALRKHMEHPSTKQKIWESAKDILHEMEYQTLATNMIHHLQNRN